MFTKILGITSALLSSAALLALSGGCPSAQGTPAQTAAPRHDATVVASRQTARAADTRTEPGLETATARHDRVTVTSAKEPPETRVETPSHTPNDNEFWIGGNWVADASGFSWRAGRIESDRPGELFVGGGWVATPQGWEFTPEYWR